MKKIQISTVEMTSNAQVIVLNSHIVVRATKAAMLCEQILEGARKIHTEPVINTETGIYEDVPTIDENGNNVYDYYDLKCREVQELYEKVLPFLQDLSNALEEGE